MRYRLDPLSPNGISLDVPSPVVKQGNGYVAKVQYLNELTDVTISGTPSDNQALAYDTASGKWIPQTISGGGGASQLSDLSDVNTSTPTNRNVLVADGVDFESRALVEADISDLGTYQTVLAEGAFANGDKTKLDGIEALADVTDTTNVTSAGALMDSELTDIASVKALNQGVATTDSPTFAGITVNSRSVQYKTVTTVGATDADYITDGTADDVQIQAAIDAVNTAGGGIVLIREGTYDITTSILMKSNVILRGEGYGTILTLANSTDEMVIKVLTQTNLSIEDLHIEGNRANQTTTDDSLGAGVSITGTTSNVTVANVYVTDTAGDGIYSAGTITNLNAINCETNATGKRGIHIAADGAKIYGGSFHDTLDHDGIQIGDNASNCIVVGAYSYNNAVKGIEIQVGSSNCSIIGCHSYDNGDVGIIFQQGANNCKIVDCIVSGNGSHGIHVDLTASTPSNYALVSGNTVIDNGDAVGEIGILIDNSDYARVVNNHVQGSARHNISLTNADYCVVSGNICLDGSDNTGTTNGSGIYLESTSDYNIITDNVCRDVQGTKTQKYGLEIASGCTGNIVLSNQLAGNLTGDYSDSGTSTQLGFINQDVRTTASPSFAGLTTSTGSLIKATSSPPASAGATGTTGQIEWDSSYIYICIASNTWRRVAHATW